MTPRNGRQSRLITKMVPPAGKLNGTTNNTVNAIFMQLYSVEIKMSNIRKGEIVMTTEEFFNKKVEQAMEKIKKEKEKKEFKGFAKQVDEYAEQSGNAVVYLEALNTDGEVGTVSSYINGKTGVVISMLTDVLKNSIKNAFPSGMRMVVIMQIIKRLSKALDDNE